MSCSVNYHNANCFNVHFWWFETCVVSNTIELQKGKKKIPVKLILFIFPTFRITANKRICWESDYNNVDSSRMKSVIHHHPTANSGKRYATIGFLPTQAVYHRLAHMLRTPGLPTTGFRKSKLCGTDPSRLSKSYWSPLIFNKNIKLGNEQFLLLREAHRFQVRILIFD